MRSISANGLAKLATHQGTEPIFIIEVDWVIGRDPSSYADRDAQGIPGRIIEVGDLDNVVGVSNKTSTQSLDITLDDTDATIKALFDAHDIHKREVRVYQYCYGLDLADKFLLFSGKIRSPVVWNERDRTMKFTIVSQLEDREVGFSAEEGQFPYLPADLVGKAWPMIFGTVQDCPALQINHAVTGTTLTGVGIISGEAQYRSLPLYDNGLNTDSGASLSGAQLSAQSSFLAECLAAWHGFPDKKAEIAAQMDQLAAQASMTGAKAAQQKQCAQTRRQQQVATAKSQGLGANPIKILGGEDFPQHTTITIDINGGLFTGHFDGESFHVSRREHPDNEEKASRVAGEQTDTGPESPQSVQWRLLPSGRARSVNWRDAERTRQWEFSLSFPLVVDRLVLQR